MGSPGRGDAGVVSDQDEREPAHEHGHGVRQGARHEGA